MKEKVSNKNKDTEILFLPEGQLIPATAKQEQMINNNIKADGERNQEISQAFIIYYKTRTKTSNMKISIETTFDCRGLCSSEQLTML